ncbi:hypothetical protein ILYODFUR_028251 [Ilyodon furcidens]|uniref:Uncharacterized protein n=1 Tax=Ilyodon furcidens TaxID=33524 RepID=A0ABV0ULI5_9TELE
MDRRMDQIFHSLDFKAAKDILQTTCNCNSSKKYSKGTFILLNANLEICDKHNKVWKSGRGVNSSAGHCKRYVLDQGRSSTHSYPPFKLLFRRQPDNSEVD